MQVVQQAPAMMYRANVSASVIWWSVRDWLHSIEPVMVYGPDGVARLVPRFVAERLAAQGKLQEAASPAAAREALGLPSVRIDAESDGFAGIDRGVMPPLETEQRQLEEVLPEIARAMLASPEPRPDLYPAFDLTTEE
jgi:hypothetical protein